MQHEHETKSRLSFGHIESFLGSHLRMGWDRSARDVDDSSRSVPLREYIITIVASLGAVIGLVVATIPELLLVSSRLIELIAPAVVAAVGSLLGAYAARTDGRLLERPLPPTIARLRERVGAGRRTLLAELGPSRTEEEA